MSARQGLIFGSVFGLKTGLNYWESVVTETIYDQYTSQFVHDFINAALGMSLDFSTVSCWPNDDFSIDNLSVNHEDNIMLWPIGGATDIESPHGRALVSDGVDKYWTISAETLGGDLDIGTAPFVYSVRIKVTSGAPASNYYIFSEGVGAGTYMGLGVDTNGKAFYKVRKDFMSPPTTVNSNVDICDGNYHWVHFGRSCAADKVWIIVDSNVIVEETFAATNDITSFTRELGFWDSTQNGTYVATEADHCLFFTGTSAENFYTNRGDLVSLVFND